MKREPIVRHDNGSVTCEGEGQMGRYLDHEFDHNKGKGDDEEHTGMYDHKEMHNIPHNQSPLSFISKAEAAAGISVSDPKMPYKKGEYLKPGEKARQWTGLRPWSK